jgi:AmmeMemoRadiSam system protein B
MDWETPLGRIRSDREFVMRIHEALGPADPLDLFLHKQEHSIEFQVLFLQHLLGDRDAEVAGFLTGALPSADGNPEAEDYCLSILDAFSTAVAESGKRTCFIAGADLAHLGPQFGDPERIDDELLEKLEIRERERLRHLEDGRPGEFFRAVEADGNPDRVCGAVPMFLAAKLAGGKGELLQYGQAPASDGSQVVSYTAMVFDQDRVASDQG